MASYNYKNCSVPMCRSTTIKTPEKIFLSVPTCPQRRKHWLQLAGRDFTNISYKSPLFFCEDHFHLPTDMENYMQYKIMGFIRRIRLKPDCLPSKFECQQDHMVLFPLPKSAESKSRHMEVLLNDKVSEEYVTPKTSSMTIYDGNDAITEKDNSCDLKIKTQGNETHVCPVATDPSIQVCFTTEIKIETIETTNQATSPFNITESEIGLAKLTYSNTNAKSIQEQLISTEYSDTSSTISVSPSVQFSPAPTSTSSDQETQSELNEIKPQVTAKDFSRRAIEMTVRLIKKNPRYYIGVTKECLHLIELVKKYTNLPEEHILLCLKKIRLNTPFPELADQFGVSLSHASKIFMRSVPLISSLLYQFISISNRRSVKQKLPMVFSRQKYNIYSIIDCLEIEIQKPSKSVEQAITWSEYKKANTAKYLISSTPDGVINYISPGYSGRTTDENLVHDCNFLDCLEPGVSILANRGFRHIEGCLLQKDIILLRPPSVSCHSKLSKRDLIKTKQIANFKRVLRGLREFSFINPHSVVKRKLLKYLDDCVIIACGLINIQDSIIKNK